MSTREFPNDWMSEKVYHSLRALVTMKKYIDENPTSPLNMVMPWSETLKDQLDGGIYECYHHLTKLLAMACDSEWEYKDEEKLIEDGLVGLKLLELKYNVQRNTSENKADKR